MARAGTFCQVAGANNRLVIGFYWSGTQGLALMSRQIKLHARRTTWGLGAVGDVWTKRVRGCQNVIGEGCKGFKNYPSVALKDIDGVVIAP